MAENLPPSSTTTPGNEESTRGMPYYEKLRRDLRETLQKKRLLDKNMVYTLCRLASKTRLRLRRH